MGMDKSLSDLAMKVNPGRGIKSVVLDNYAAITAARQHLWPWSAIALALQSEHPGRPEYTEANVSKAYRRVRDMVKSGKLKPATGKAQGQQAAAGRAGSLRPDAQPPAVSRGLPPGASRSASDVEALRAKGVRVHS